jgi:GNAT superfamily N-acetyltransferase
MDTSEVHWAPLTEQTWTDFEEVMGANGGARGCWCMHWRLSFTQWQQGRGPGNRTRIAERAAADPPPGVVCYVRDEPVGWVGIADRAEYPRMQRSSVTRPIDDTPAWVISCIYLRREYRRRRLQAAMIAAACEFAAEHGRHTVEAHPVDPAHGKRAGADNAMTGIASAYRAAGFTEMARPKPDRPIMRRVVASTSRAPSR